MRLTKSTRRVYSLRMDPKEAVEIIESAGGDSAFARLLGLHEQRGYRQRVSNWKRRGIPAVVLLRHLDTINELRTKARAA